VRSKEEAVLVPFMVLPLEISWLGTNDVFFETFQAQIEGSENIITLLYWKFKV